MFSSRRASQVAARLQAGRLLNCTAFPQCQDRRVLLVLQGTQFIKPDSTIVNYLDGNDYPFLATFPYIPAPHPLPGAAGTIDYPTQQ